MRYKGQETTTERTKKQQQISLSWYAVKMWDFVLVSVVFFCSSCFTSFLSVHQKLQHSTQTKRFLRNRCCHHNWVWWPINLEFLFIYVFVSLQFFFSAYVGHQTTKTHTKLLNLCPRIHHWNKAADNTKNKRTLTHTHTWKKLKINRFADWLIYFRNSSSDNGPDEMKKFSFGFFSSLSLVGFALLVCAQWLKKKKQKKIHRLH